MVLGIINILERGRFKISETLSVLMEVVIIHGSKTYLDGPKWFRKLTYRIASCFCSESPSFRYVYDFKKFLEKRKIKAEVFRWSGSIALTEIKKASGDLEKFLKRKKKVILFGKSNGGLISQLFVTKNKNKISKIVQIGTPNLSNRYTMDTPLVNVYSSRDNMQRNGIFLYSILRRNRGARRLIGNFVKNVEMKLEQHRDFNDEKFFDFYYKLIVGKS